MNYSPAKLVENSSSLVVQTAAFAVERVFMTACGVPNPPRGRAAANSILLDMCVSTTQITPLHLVTGMLKSIASSWRKYSADIYCRMRKCTTRMAKKTTTELRTWNYGCEASLAASVPKILSIGHAKYLLNMARCSR